MNVHIAVVGGGIFGVTSALELAQAGYQVTLIESRDGILKGASSNNQNRLHLGFHYPRDLATAMQSIKGFEDFKVQFGECVTGDFNNAYFISDQDSMTSYGDYLKFCDKLGIWYHETDPTKFEIRVTNVAGGIVCGEAVYDFVCLTELLLQRLGDSNVSLMLNAYVTTIDQIDNKYKLEMGDGGKLEADFVVNATYANINHLTTQLGHDAAVHQYEYTVVPIIEWDHPRVGITVMDGKFMTLLPLGKSNQFLLYHVDHSVIERYDGQLLNSEWLYPETSPFQHYDQEEGGAKFIAQAKNWVPEISSAKVTGFLHGPRMVLANRDSTDERPSIINDYGDGYVTVFSGKIDHCVWVARDVRAFANRYFNG